MFLKAAKQKPKGWRKDLGASSDKIVPLVCWLQYNKFEPSRAR